MNYEFHYRTENDKIILENSNGFKQVAKMFERGTLTVSKRKKERSIQQNSYYWAAVIPITKQGLIDAGYQNIGIAEVHQLLKGMFLKKEIVNEATGDILTLAGSTAELSTVEFLEFIEKIATWLAEYLNVILPEPGQQIEIE